MRLADSPSSHFNPASQQVLPDEQIVSQLKKDLPKSPTGKPVQTPVNFCGRPQNSNSKDTLSASSQEEATSLQAADSMLKALISQIYRTIQSSPGQSASLESNFEPEPEPQMTLEQCLDQLPGNQASPDSKGGQMRFEEVVSTIGRNEKLLNKAKDIEGLKKLRDDPETPADFKKALDTLVNNKEMFDAIESSNTGKKDGKISSDDFRSLQDEPLIRQYADKKAEDYTQNYIPSNAPPDAKPRQMTANDAMKELYQYSESLPGDINLKKLQKIADGSKDMDKAPPQVAAAAKYFTQHPDEWQKFTRKDDPNGTVSRDRLCDLAAYNVKLSPQEDKALKTVLANEDTFLSGGMKKGKLKDIANDETKSKEVRDAANLLSQENSMLFSMLDNGKHGAGGNFFNKANDGNVTKGDINAFMKNGTGQVADPAKNSPVTKDPAAISAKQDMVYGQQTQPDKKAEKGGGVFKMLEAFSWIATGASVLFAGGAGLIAGLGRTIASTAVKEGMKTGAKEAGEAFAKESAKHGVKENAKETGKEVLKEGAKRGTKEGIREGREEYQNNKELNDPTVWAQN